MMKLCVSTYPMLSLACVHNIRVCQAHLRCALKALHGLSQNLTKLWQLAGPCMRHNRLL